MAGLPLQPLEQMVVRAALVIVIGNCAIVNNELIVNLKETSLVFILLIKIK